MSGCDIKKRLDASKTILSATRGLPTFDRVQAAEVQALQAFFLSGASWGPVELADAIGAITNVGLHQDHQTALITTIADLLAGAIPAAPMAGTVGPRPSAARLATASAGPGAGPAPGTGNVAAEIEPLRMPSGRTKQQNFQGFWNFIPQDVWVSLRDGGSTDKMLELAFSLGLRFGTEYTWRDMGCVAILAMEGYEKAKAMQRSTRVTYCKSLKANFSKIVGEQSSQPPAVWIDKLPVTPKELRAMHPQHYEKTYAEQEPARCPLDMIQLNEIIELSRCRKFKGNDCPMLHLGGDMMLPPGMAQFASQIVSSISAIKDTVADLKSGGSRGRISFAFPDRSIGDAQRALPPRGPLALEDKIPPEPAPPQAEAPATKDNQPDGPRAEQEAKAGAKRKISVAEASKAILASMDLTGPDTVPKKAGRPVTKKAGRPPKPKAPPKAKPKAKPTKGGAARVWFKVQNDRVQCFYNKLPAKAFPYDNKKEATAAEKSAKDLPSQLQNNV